MSVVNVFVFICLHIFLGSEAFLLSLRLLLDALVCSHGQSVVAPQVQSTLGLRLSSSTGETLDSGPHILMRSPIFAVYVTAKAVSSWHWRASFADRP